MDENQDNIENLKEEHQQLMDDAAARMEALLPQPPEFALDLPPEAPLAQPPAIEAPEQQPPPEFALDLPPEQPLRQQQVEANIPDGAPDSNLAPQPEITLDPEPPQEFGLDIPSPETLSMPVPPKQPAPPPGAAVKPPLDALEFLGELENSEAGPQQVDEVLERVARNQREYAHANLRLLKLLADIVIDHTRDIRSIQSDLERYR